MYGNRPLQIPSSDGGGYLKRFQRMTVDRMVGTQHFAVAAYGEAYPSCILRLFEGYAALRTDETGAPQEVPRWEELAVAGGAHNSTDLPWIWTHTSMVVLGSNGSSEDPFYTTQLAQQPFGGYRDIRVKRRLPPETDIFCGLFWGLFHLIGGGILNDEPLDATDRVGVLWYTGMRAHFR